jgi:hypothetical protein
MAAPRTVTNNLIFAQLRLHGGRISTERKPSGITTKFHLYNTELRADANTSSFGTDNATIHWVSAQLRLFSLDQVYEDDQVIVALARAQCSMEAGAATWRLDAFHHHLVGIGSPSSNPNYFESVNSFGPAIFITAGTTVNALQSLGPNLGRHVRVGTSAYVYTGSAASEIE